MDPVEWLDDDEQRLWRALLESFALLDRQIADDLRGHGLSTPEYEVLALLSEAPDRRLRMTALADLLVFHKSRLSYQVRRLEDRGLVERTPCEDDGRGWYVGISGDGLALLEAAAPDHVAGIRAHVFDRIPAESVRELTEVLETIAASLRTERPDAASARPISPRGIRSVRR